MCPSLERDNEHFRPAVTPGYPTLCFAAGKHYSRTSSERDPGQNYRTNTKTSFMKNVTMPIITDTFQSQPGAPRATTFLINTDTKNQSRAEPGRAGQRCGRTHLVLPRRTSRSSGRSRPSTSSSSSGDMILPLSGTHTGALLCGSAHTHIYTRTSPEAFKIKHTNFSLFLSIIWMPHVTHRIQSYKNKDKNEAAKTQISFTECVFFVDVGLEWKLAVSWDSCSPRL